MTRYQELTIAGLRSPAVAQKIARHLDHFCTFFTERSAHDRISACLKRDVEAWRDHQHREQDLSAATVNNHRVAARGASHARPLFRGWLWVYTDLQ